MSLLLVNRLLWIPLRTSEQCPLSEYRRASMKSIGTMSLALTSEVLTNDTFYIMRKYRLERTVCIINRGVARILEKGGQ